MVEKVIIKGFGDSDMTSAKKGEFVLPINPENMTRSFKIERDTTQAGGNQHTNAQYDVTKSEDLKFDFILDHTNTIEGYSDALKSKTVPEQIKMFLDVAYNLKSDTHQPNKIKIIWGNDFVFDSVLTSLSITYTLFSAEGTVLRAKLSTSFTGYVSPEKRVRIEDKTQGTLTKVLPKIAGERIADIAQKVYSDPSIYLQIAKANNIINFRSLKDAVNLILPPVQKAAEQVSDTVNNVTNTVNNATNTANNAANKINNALNRFR